MRFLNVTYRVLCSLLLLPATGLATGQQLRNYAAQLVEEGSRHAAAGRHEEALSSFEASIAYDTRLSSMWSIATSHLMLGDGELAAAYLDRYMSNASRHRGSFEMQQAVAAIAEAGPELERDDLRRELVARLRNADQAVRSGTASRATRSDLLFGVGADTPELGQLSEAARNRGTALFRAGLEASGTRDVEGALREFERSLAYRRIRNAVYNISVCHLMLGRRDLASHFLDWYVDNRPEVASDPRVQAVQRAISESPEDIGAQDRRLLLWENLYDGVEEPMTITAGGTRSREVPEHLDHTLAMIEESFHGTVENNTTCFLMSVARSKSEYLMSPPSPMGPCQRRAVAQSLILVYNEIDGRLQQAPLGPGGTAREDCIEWDPDDPLGGDLSSVSPFSMLDAWTAIESENRRECVREPEATPTPARRRPTRSHVPPRRGVTPTETVTPTPSSVPPVPEPPADSCERRENWIECALRDPDVRSFRVRHLLQRYPNLARGYFSPRGICSILQNSGWTVQDLQVSGRGSDPNQWIRRAVAEARNYDLFVGRMRSLEDRVNSSAARISSCEMDTADCPGAIWASCILLREQWYWPLQRNPNSIYYLPR
jgi:tetratricopeptide (TPR) repeat protein